eukprot:COSAG01_NODE_691_length_14217_cov_7.862658_3_plen_71_part_00
MENSRIFPEKKGLSNRFSKISVMKSHVTFMVSRLLKWLDRQISVVTLTQKFVETVDPENFETQILQQHLS